MYDFKDLTILIFARIDNEERGKNLKAITSFYRKACTNVKFVISEEDSEMKVPGIIDLTENDVYNFTLSNDQWNKCEGYNKAIKLAKTNILVFNDVDVIIHPEQILMTADKLQQDDNSGLMYPYNGLFLCVPQKIKDQFCDKLDYDSILREYIPPSHLIPDVIETAVKLDTDNPEEYVVIGHNNSKGGCVMGRRDNLIKCNGYNPNFKGWGFEDDEMPVRVHKLGYEVDRLGGEGRPCWHLHHEDGKGSPKETQPYHDDNERLFYEILNSDKSQLEEYIKTWEL